MKSYIVRNKKMSEVLTFLENNPKIYASTLQKILGCSKDHSKRVVNQIKKERGIKTSYVSSEDIKDYFDINN
ncbi:MAG: hypothetical protein JXM74_06235 [Fusobacteriaceae bacterium]|nr:hypothetical protein [Fusobacteriaceae bacterium]